MAPVPIGRLVVFLQPVVLAIFPALIVLRVPLAVVAVFVLVPVVIVLVVAVVNPLVFCVIVAIMVVVGRVPGPAPPTAQPAPPSATLNSEYAYLYGSSSVPLPSGQCGYKSAPPCFFCSFYNSFVRCRATQAGGHNSMVCSRWWFFTVCAQLNSLQAPLVACLSHGPLNRAGKN